MQNIKRHPIISKSTFLILFVILLFFALINTSYAKDLEWKEISDFRTYNYRDMAVSESGLYVVVGDSGRVEISSDLKKWESSDSGTKEYLFGCTFGNGKFVAVGQKGTIIYSQDGTKWGNADVGKDVSFEDVTFGNGKFMAVGSKYPLTGKDDLRVILTSEDGIKWTVVLDNKGEFEWNSIKYINNMFVVSGLWNSIAFSQDGTNWTVKDLGEIRIHDIIWDGSRYIGVSSKSKIYTSYDLMEWKPVSNNFNGEFFLNNIMKFNNQYLIVLTDSGRNILLTSKDLSLWNIASERYYSEISSFIISNNKLIGIGWNNSILETTDCVKWNISERQSANFSKVIWNGSNFLAAGTDGRIFISLDGLEWKEYSTTIKKILTDIVWTGDKYIALGLSYGEGDEQYTIVDTEVYQSGDGINWTSNGTLGMKNMESIFYFNKKYFILGRDGEIESSNDAIHWTEVSSGTESWLRGMAWNGKTYVCVGMFGTILTSADGNVWTPQAAGTANDLNRIIWNGEQFVSVGGWKTATRSFDGFKWEARAEKDSTSFEDVVWDGNGFFVLPNVGETYSSIDGKTWTKNESISTGSFRSVAWNGYRYVVIGGGGEIETSVPTSFVKVVVNGKPVLFDIAPVNRDGRNLVPLRAIFSSLGADVQWDAASRTITAKKDGTVIVLKLDSKNATVNGVGKSLDVAPISYKGRTMVPARFIAESLDADVTWDGITQTVIITSKNK